MTDRKDGGPAFPVSIREGLAPGMNLRDWFAGQVLAGFLASPNMDNDAQDEDVAAACYGVADAMIKERDKE